jgi:NADH-quinone oxidoreductase subunit G
VRRKRAKGIYENDRMLQLHKSQDNPYITELYKNVLGEIGGHKAHSLLHTSYHMRKRITDEDMTLTDPSDAQGVEVNVCFGTGCFLKGSQKLLHRILEHLKANNMSASVDVSASFCYEKCDRGPVIRVGETVIEGCTFEKAIEAIESEQQMRTSHAGKISHG